MELSQPGAAFWACKSKESVVVSRIRVECIAFCWGGGGGVVRQYTVGDYGMLDVLCHIIPRFSSIERSPSSFSNTDSWLGVWGARPRQTCDEVNATKLS